MDRKEFAAMLNGRNYKFELTEAEEALAKELELIVIFALSDDLLGFRGFIHTDFGAWSGAKFFITAPGSKIPLSDNTFRKARKYGVVKLIDDNFDDADLNETNYFDAKYTFDNYNWSWKIDTNMPHSTFDIQQNGIFYCRGLVINATDLE